MTGPLSGRFAAEADRQLADDDRRIRARFGGADSGRQPVHTVYLAADRFTPTSVDEWRERALRAVADADGMVALARQVGISRDVAHRVSAKLAAEPIEDLRLDFEDGYGVRGDRTEDADAETAARAVAEATLAGTAPASIGIRFKSFEPDTRRRGLRTLEVFLLTLADAGPLPDGLIMTLPKVTTPGQVLVMAEACGRLETALALPPGRLRFEVQVETPGLIVGPDGTSPLPEIIRRAGGRVTGLHFGTYDYADALDIAPAHQSMEHPAADHAKAVMQLAAAGTGVRLSDGSSNVLPVGDAVQRREAFTLHARLVRRSLERGFYQGWDLHPAQLPTRFLATYAFYRDGFPAAATRLRNYVSQRESAVLDEPATARGLARFIRRGLACGALDDDDVAEAGIPAGRLHQWSRPDRPAEGG